MPATAHTFALAGIEASAVIAEVDVHLGLPAFTVVGLPDAAVRESRERVRAAIVNSGFEFPLKRITANLAPADLRKAGPGFDLAIAAALLGACDRIPPRFLARHWLAGELALDGTIRPICGALAMAECAKQAGADALVVPRQNVGEAGLVGGLEVIGLDSLTQLCELALGNHTAQAPNQEVGGDRITNGNGNGNGNGRWSENGSAEPFRSLPDLAVLRGQPWVRSALEVAAAGGHSILIVGPPGAGKSLAVRCLPGLMPPLAAEEAIEVARIAGATGRSVPPGGPKVRPYRAPHHTISAAGLVGGGNPLRPGEVTLAHRGVLFLDELPEFSRSALEALRGPLEDGEVSVRRLRYCQTLPARFMLAAAANPCPCGRGSAAPRCTCTPDAIARYGAKLSGALADRIDLLVEVEQPSSAAMAGDEGESSEAVRQRVIAARRRQSDRLGAGRCNADMDPGEVRRHSELDRAAARTLARGHERLGLSARGWERALRVARTIADLEGRDSVGCEQVAAALSFRAREQR